MNARTRILAAFLAGLIALSAPVFAKELTEAEIASRDKTRMTEAQRKADSLDCDSVFTIAPNKIETSAGPLTVVDLTATQVLAIILVTQDDPEDKKSYAISAVDDLPNGGIGGRDLCFRIDVTEPGRGTAFGGEAILASWVGLLLRPGHSIDADYPQSAPLIKERRQKRHLPAMRMAVIRQTEEPVHDVIARITDGDSRFSTTLPTLLIKGWIYIPLSAEAS